MPPSYSAQTSRDYPTTLQVGSCVDLIAVGLGARSRIGSPHSGTGRSGRLREGPLSVHGPTRFYPVALPLPSSQRIAWSNTEWLGALAQMIHGTPRTRVQACVNP
jgi:hypothetical protein